MHTSLIVTSIVLVVAVNCAENGLEGLNANLFGGIPEDSPYWWMSKGSPFKRAVAAGPPAQQFDFASNPFLRSGNANAKLYSAPGYLPPDQPQTTPCSGNGRVCVPKYQCSNGQIDANQVSGKSSQECNADEACCAVRYPPPPPPPPSPQPTPSATRVTNSYIPPPQPTRAQPNQCYGNSVCAPQNQCAGGSISRSNTRAAPASQCYAPEVCCRVQDEPKPQPTVNVITYQPAASTSRPYVTPAVQTARPVLTRKPNNGYLPPKEGEATNQVGVYLPPSKGEDELSEPIAPQQPASANDSPVFVPRDDEAPQLPPVQCPAATNCTEIEYCSADGSISKTPVALTKEQEAFRVPLSDCRDLSRGITGKCCRDLDYTDPWPTSLLRTGAFDANILAQSFDDGQYRPDNGNGNGRNPALRGEAQKSPQIFNQNITPAQSVEIKQFTLAPFNPNAIQNKNNANSVPQHKFQQPQPQQLQQSPIQPHQPHNQPQLNNQAPFNQPPNHQPHGQQPSQSHSQTPNQPQGFPHTQQPGFPYSQPNQQQPGHPQNPQAFQPNQHGEEPRFPNNQQSDRPSGQYTGFPHGQQPSQPNQPHFQPNQPQQHQPFNQQPIDDEPYPEKFFTPQPLGQQTQTQEQFQQFTQQPFNPHHHNEQPQFPHNQQSFTQQPHYPETPKQLGQQDIPEQLRPQPFAPHPAPSTSNYGTTPSFVSSSPAQNPFGRFNSPSSGVCAVRDTTGLPRGNLPNEASFGEFPWQAMILRESTKSILCGGAIIENNVVATAAHCVDGLRTHDVLVKAGEWKLGSNEEPKPFQTVRVRKITMHPAYEPSNLESDLALLHLENDLKFDKHIGAICIDENELEPVGHNEEECVTSGWGKENIKYHVAGALPHSLAINPLSGGECQQSLNSHNPNTAVCGRAQGNPCDVDNGSALACTRGNGKYVLKGIYSGESGCGPNQVMSFTKMDVPFLNGVHRGSAEKSLPIHPARSYSPLQTTAVTSPIATGQRSNLVQTTYSYPTPQPQANTIHNFVVPTDSSRNAYLPPN